MPKPSKIAERETALSTIWNNLPQEFIDKAIISFYNRVRSRVATVGEHFKHNLKIQWTGDIHH